MCKKKSKEKEPLMNHPSGKNDLNEKLREIASEMLSKINLLFLNAFQLLAIWIMLGLQWVTECRYGKMELAGNLLAFDIVACAANLAGMFKREKEKTQWEEELVRFAVWVMIVLICFASILYALIMLHAKEINILLQENEIWWTSWTFTLLVLLISMLWEMGR